MKELLFYSQDGERIDISPYSFDGFISRPLGFDELVYSVTEDSPRLTVELENARVSSSSASRDTEKRSTISCGFKHRGRVEVFGLVEGGWLPLPWAHKRVAWVDRNVVSAIAKAHGQGINLPWADSGMGLGQDTERVNPLLFALEGNRRRTPTFAEMSAALDDGAEVLRKVLPARQVEVADRDARVALYGELLRLQRSASNSAKLLREVYPLVVHPRNERGRRDAEQLVCSRAKDLGASPLTLLALLSCLHDQASATPLHNCMKPGRAVLKPAKLSTSAGIYNALTDLSFIELLLGTLAVLPGVNPVLYTRDIGLAALWVALSPKNPKAHPKRNGNLTPEWTFTASSNLFPALTNEECGRLVKDCFA